MYTTICCSDKEIIDPNEEVQTILRIHMPDLVNDVDYSSRIMTLTDKGYIYSYKMKKGINTYLFKDYNNDYCLVRITKKKIIYKND